MNDTRLAEVADGTYQLTTYLPDVDFSVIQYLVLGDEPLLFHTARSAGGHAERVEQRADALFDVVADGADGFDVFRPRRGLAGGPVS